MPARWFTNTPSFTMIAREHLDELEELELMLNEIWAERSLITDDDVRSRLLA